MLNMMREGTGAKVFKYVALGFVMFGVFGMIFMDVNGMYRSGAVGSNNLAKIGNRTVSLAEFERLATPVIRAQNMTMNEAYKFGLLQQIASGVVVREAMMRQAEEQGIRVTRPVVAPRVHELLKGQINQGETPQAALNRILAAQGVTEAQLEQNLKENITVSLLETPLRAAGAYSPDLSAKALAKFQGEKRDVQYFTVTPESVKFPDTIDDQTLRSYYDGIKETYQIPEKRVFEVATITAADVKNSIKLADADVRKAYDERKDQFVTPEQRAIEQAVVTDEKQAAAIAADMKKGVGIRRAIKNAGAKPESYRALATFDAGGLPTELSAPVFAAAENGVVGPVKTTLGWHVARVADISAARKKSFDEMRAPLRQELEADAVHTAMEERISQIEDALSSDDNLEQVAKSLEMKLQTVGPVDARGMTDSAPANGIKDPILASVAQNPDLLTNLFELLEGENSDLVRIDDNTFAVFSIKTITPSRDRDLAEVRAEVEKRWHDEKRNQALDERARDLHTKLEKGDVDFAAAARDAGVALRTQANLGRESRIEAIADPMAVNKIFEEEDMDRVVRFRSDNGITLLKVTAVKFPETPSQQEVATARTQWRDMSQQALTDLMISALYERYNMEINQGLLEKQYGQSANAGE